MLVCGSQRTGQHTLPLRTHTHRPPQEGTPRTHGPSQGHPSSDGASPHAGDRPTPRTTATTQAQAMPLQHGTTRTATVGTGLFALPSAERQESPARRRARPNPPRCSCYTPGSRQAHACAQLDTGGKTRALPHTPALHSSERIPVCMRVHTCSMFTHVAACTHAPRRRGHPPSGTAALCTPTPPAPHTPADAPPAQPRRGQPGPPCFYFPPPPAREGRKGEKNKKKKTQRKAGRRVRVSVCVCAEQISSACLNNNRKSKALLSQQVSEQKPSAPPTSCSEHDKCLL